MTVLAAAILLPSTAFAASSAWEKVAGGAVRVVTEGLPGKNGHLRGALEINLSPGWKTYWRDPGDAGVPPMVGVSKPADGVTVDIAFPVPTRFDDGYTVWAGYKHPVALPLTFKFGRAETAVDVSVFLGICEEVCIPVQADFSIDLADSPDGAMDREIVEAAFAALPRPAHDGFRATLRAVEPDKLAIDAELPGNGDVQLFVASTEDWSFGAPKPVSNDGGVSFDVPVYVMPDKGAAAETIHYTLVTSESAVSGTFEITP